MIVKSEESMCRRRELIIHVYLVKMLTKPMNFANHGVPNHSVPCQSIRNLLLLCGPSAATAPPQKTTSP